MFPSKRLLILMVVLSMVIGYSSCDSDLPITPKPPLPPQRGHPLFQARMDFQTGDGPSAVFSMNK